MQNVEISPYADLTAIVDDVLQLVGDNGVQSVLKGGTPEAKHPVDNHQPRQATAKAKTNRMRMLTPSISSR